MKSIRLNKTIRTQIADNIAAAYEAKNKRPKVVTLEFLKTELEKVIKKVYLAEAKVLEDKAASAGLTKYLNTVDYKFIYKKGYYLFNMDFDRKVINLNTESAVYIDLETTTNKEIQKAYKTYLSGHKKVKADTDKTKAWELARHNYMTDVNNVLDGVTTTKQLLEVWPECEKFIPKGLVNPSSINLPAVSIKNLNNKI